MESATVRVRPLRFAFVVEPKDKASLQRIFEVNSFEHGAQTYFFTSGLGESAKASRICLNFVLPATENRQSSKLYPDMMAKPEPPPQQSRLQKG
jgi:hypothetical protein